MTEDERAENARTEAERAAKAAQAYLAEAGWERQCDAALTNVVVIKRLMGEFMDVIMRHCPAKTGDTEQALETLVGLMSATCCVMLRVTLSQWIEGAGKGETEREDAMFAACNGVRMWFHKTLDDMVASKLEDMGSQMVQEEALRGSGVLEQFEDILRRAQDRERRGRGEDGDAV